MKLKEKFEKAGKKGLAFLVGTLFAANVSCATWTKLNEITYDNVTSYEDFVEKGFGCNHDVSYNGIKIITYKMLI